MSLTVTKFLITSGEPRSKAVKSEILDLSDSGNQQCPEWPNYPLEVFGATGGLIGGKVIICGGCCPATDKCHVLTKTKSKFLTTMTIFL